MVIPFIGYCVTIDAGIKVEICFEKKGNKTFHFIPLSFLVKYGHRTIEYICSLEKDSKNSSFDLTAVSISYWLWGSRMVNSRLSRNCKTSVSKFETETQNYPKIRLWELSQTFPRFQDRVKISETTRFSRNHSISLVMLSVVHGMRLLNSRASLSKGGFRATHVEPEVRPLPSTCLDANKFVLLLSSVFTYSYRENLGKTTAQERSYQHRLLARI